MKQIKYNSGGQPFFNSDFALQQTELYKAIEDQFKDTQGVVISGGVVTGNSISPALVYLDGKIRELAAATGLTFPCYIRAATQIDYDSRVHTEDNQSKSTKSEFRAEIVGSVPSGNYITVSATGCNKRLQYLLKNSENIFETSGFDLNKGRVSYVEISRNTNQTLATGINLVTWTTEIDDLGEFNATTSEFVASQDGIYTVSFSARVDITTTSGFDLSVEFWNGSAWVVVANSLRNTANIQGAITVSANKKLTATQKIRIIVNAFGTGFGTLQYAYASIVRIA